MIQIKKLLFLLTLISASYSNAILLEMTILENKGENGKPHYVYCLSDCHAEYASHHALRLLTSRSSEFPPFDIDEVSNRKLILDTLLKYKMADKSVEQADILREYACSLPANQVLLINEDIYNYDGPDKKQIEGLQKALPGSLLPRVTQRFKQSKLPVVNAEFRYLLTGKPIVSDDDWKELAEDFFTAHKAIEKQVSASTAPEEFVTYSRRMLEIAQQQFHAGRQARNYDRGICSGMLNAKLLHLFWDHRNTQHIFLHFGHNHIMHVIPHLEKVGYKVIFSNGRNSLEKIASMTENVAQKLLSDESFDDLLELPFFCGIDVKKGFDDFVKKQSAQPPSNPERKQDEKSSSSLQSMAIACGNCGKSQPNMPFCTQCKKIWYCKKECQIQHWKEHKNVCAGLK